jgi:hypothetical protein
MSDAPDRLVATFEDFGGESLRDVWLFDQWTHQQLYARDDVSRVLAELDVDAFVDNERYGYVTRDTYESLYYAEYAYTVRGFDSFEQFRTFLAEEGTRVGVLASFDRRDGGYDWGALHESVVAVADDYPVAEFVPADETEE